MDREANMIDFDPKRGPEGRKDDETLDVLPQKDLNKKIDIHIGNEREKGAKIYFNFDTKEMRDAAIEVLDNLSEVSKHGGDGYMDFYFGSKPDPNPNKSETGIEIEFFRNPQGLERKIFELLRDRAIIPKTDDDQVFKTVEGEQVPVQI